MNHNTSSKHGKGQMDFSTLLTDFIYERITNLQSTHTPSDAPMNFFKRNTQVGTWSATTLKPWQ